MNPPTRGIGRGWTVLGSNGSMLGTVADVTSERLLVERFDRVGSVMEVPASAIAAARDGVVTLSAAPDAQSGGPEAPDGRMDASLAQEGSSVPGDAVGDAGYAGPEAADGYAEPDSTGWESSRADEEPVVVRLHEEQLRAQKELREAGALNVRKQVVEEQRQIDVPIMRERVEVTRRPVDQPLEGSQRVFSEGDTVRFLMVEERVEVRKVPWIVEEVVIRRVRTEDVKHVVETVRREQLAIEEEGAVDVQGAPGTPTA